MSVKTDLPSLLSARADRAKSRDVRKFRPDIEGLRAVAVTLVALSHLGLALPGGYVGVDVFFVISGFLITRQLTAELDQTGRISFRGFYARRVRRILPAATVVIVGTVLACWRWDSPLRVKTDASDGLFAAFSAINWRLAVNGTNYFQASSPPSPFQHFWSLSVEEQFYAVWPVLLLVIGVAAGRRYGRRKSAVWALLVIIAAALVLTTQTTASSPSWAYFGTQTRVWELALGALLAVTVAVWTKMPPALASQMSWLGLAMIALAAFVYDGSTAYPRLGCRAARHGLGVRHRRGMSRLVAKCRAGTQETSGPVPGPDVIFVVPGALAGPDHRPIGDRACPQHRGQVARALRFTRPGHGNVLRRRAARPQIVLPGAKAGAQLGARQHPGGRIDRHDDTGLRLRGHPRRRGCRPHRRRDVEPQSSDGGDRRRDKANEAAAEYHAVT